MCIYLIVDPVVSKRCPTLPQQKCRLGEKYRAKLLHQQELFESERSEMVQLVRQECADIIEETQALLAFAQQHQEQQHQQHHQTHHHEQQHHQQEQQHHRQEQQHNHHHHQEQQHHQQKQHHQHHQEQDAIVSKAVGTASRLSAPHDATVVPTSATDAANSAEGFARAVAPAKAGVAIVSPPSGDISKRLGNQDQHQDQQGQGQGQSWRKLQVHEVLRRYDDSVSSAGFSGTAERQDVVAPARPPYHPPYVGAKPRDGRLDRAQQQHPQHQHNQQEAVSLFASASGAAAQRAQYMVAARDIPTTSTSSSINNSTGVSGQMLLYPEMLSPELTLELVHNIIGHHSTTANSHSSVSSSGGGVRNSQQGSMASRHSDTHEKEVGVERTNGRERAHTAHPSSKSGNIIYSSSRSSREYEGLSSSLKDRHLLVQQSVDTSLTNRTMMRKSSAAKATHSFDSDYASVASAAVAVAADGMHVRGGGYAVRSSHGHHYYDRSRRNNDSYSTSKRSSIKGSRSKDQQQQQQQQQRGVAQIW